jgi:hypothetical protein
MAFSFLYLAVRALLGALVRSRRGLHVKGANQGLRFAAVVRAGQDWSVVLSPVCS